jgi:hypothetical protein
MFFRNYRKKLNPVKLCIILRVTMESDQIAIRKDVLILKQLISIFQTRCDNGFLDPTMTDIHTKLIQVEVRLNTRIPNTINPAVHSLQETIRIAIIRGLHNVVADMIKWLNAINIDIKYILETTAIKCIPTMTAQMAAVLIDAGLPRSQILTAARAAKNIPIIKLLSPDTI